VNIDKLKMILGGKKMREMYRNPSHDDTGKHYLY